MGTAIVTITVMPETPETDIDKIQEEVNNIVREFAGEGERKISVEPLAFGLKALKYIFVMDESLGSPDVAAEKCEKIQGVQSAEVSDVRRAVG